MTLSVLEFPYCNLFQVQYFFTSVFILDLFLLLHACMICANEYLLTRVVGIYSHSVHRTSSQCIGSGVVPSLDPNSKASGLGEKASPLKLENIYQANSKFEYLQKKVIPSGAFTQPLN